VQEIGQLCAFVESQQWRVFACPFSEDVRKTVLFFVSFLREAVRKTVLFFVLFLRNALS
jgi:hypothetical protein